MAIVQDFARAFNRQDVGALVACFTEAATYHDTFYGEHRGHAGLRAMFERMFHEGREYAWAMDLVVDSPTRAAADKPNANNAAHSNPDRILVTYSAASGGRRRVGHPVRR